MDTAIEIKQISKSYGSVNALIDVDFIVKKAECFGVLGPTGSGKSTLLKLICSISPLSKGEIYVGGLSVKTNPQRVKSNLGIFLQGNDLDYDFSAANNLILFGRYKGLSQKVALNQARKLLRLMQLEDHENSVCDSLNKFQRRKLLIARAMVGEPKILILEEPTLGLDAKEKVWIWEMIAKLKRQGITILLATHQMDEAERLCNRIAMLNEGRVLSIGRPKDLITREIGQEVVEFSVDKKDLDYYLSKVREEFEYQVLNNKVRLYVKGGQEGKKALNFLSSNRILIRKASLDDVFLKMSGHELEVEM